MQEERMRILNMLAEGKVTVEEAARLLEALSATEPTEAGAPPAGRGRPRYLRVVITGGGRGEGRGGDRVNVRVPLKLLRAGMKLKSLIPSHARNAVNGAMRRQGVHFDLDNLKSADIDELIEGLAEMSVDVEDDGDHVRVYCE
jgi:hypothetical protein